MPDGKLDKLGKLCNLEKTNRTGGEKCRTIHERRQNRNYSYGRSLRPNPNQTGGQRKQEKGVRRTDGRRRQDVRYSPLKGDRQKGGASCYIAASRLRYLFFS